MKHFVIILLNNLISGVLTLGIIVAVLWWNFIAILLLCGRPSDHLITPGLDVAWHPTIGTTMYALEFLALVVTFAIFDYRRKS